ncbi:hypothetical protein [Microvirga sp. BSC39]|uniref:hypothetical protein n=1 Tax=Microvirga sp. BSC39 TaxID=1549810 RepID=UPI0004E892F4|nr:hypothetical protein [Microvirga sp. BSC39]KFG66728.1 hypothetical protein JH26_25590 [Microvirga sp. BSC39]
MIDDNDINRLMQEQKALSLLDTIMRDVNKLFDHLDKNRSAQVEFGFVSILAVSEIARMSFNDVKRVGCSALRSYSGAEIDRASLHASEIARKRQAARQSGDHWGVISNAMVAKHFAETMRTQGTKSAKEQGAVYAENVAQRLLDEIDKCIAAYRNASQAELKTMGIAGVASNFDRDLQTPDAAPPAEKRRSWLARLLGAP